jgi:hypothetical protein
MTAYGLRGRLIGGGWSESGSELFVAVVQTTPGAGTSRPPLISCLAISSTTPQLRCWVAVCEPLEAVT